MKIFTIKIIRDLNRLVKQGKITSSKMVELMNEAVSCDPRVAYNGKQYLKRGIKYLDELMPELREIECEHYFPFAYDEKTEEMIYDNPCKFCGAESPYKNRK